MTAGKALQACSQADSLEELLSVYDFLPEIAEEDKEDVIEKFQGYLVGYADRKMKDENDDLIANMLLGSIGLLGEKTFDECFAVYEDIKAVLYCEQATVIPEDKKSMTNDYVVIMIIANIKLAELTDENIAKILDNIKSDSGERQLAYGISCLLKEQLEDVEESSEDNDSEEISADDDDFYLYK